MSTVTSSTCIGDGRGLCQPCGLMMSSEGIRHLTSERGFQHSQIGTFETRAATCRLCAYLWDEVTMDPFSLVPRSVQRLRDLMFPSGNLASQPHWQTSRQIRSGEAWVVFWTLGNGGLRPGTPSYSGRSDVWVPSWRSHQPRASVPPGVACIEKKAFEDLVLCIVSISGSSRKTLWTSPILRTVAHKGW